MGAGFEADRISDAEVTTEWLEIEQAELLALEEKGTLNETDQKRLVTLNTIINSRKAIES